MFNPIIRGWISYYGKFYKTGVSRIGSSFNAYLVKWVQQKYKRFARHKIRAIEYVRAIAKKRPNLFAHWQQGNMQVYQ